MGALANRLAEYWKVFLSLKVLGPHKLVWSLQSR